MTTATAPGPRAATARAWASRHPVAAFIGLTLAWSWACWLPLQALVGRGGLLQAREALPFVLAALGGIGPSLAGLTLAAWTQGRLGLQRQRRRLQRWRLGRLWWAVAVIPGLTALTPLLRAALGLPVDAAGIAGRLLPGLALGLFAGLGEEIGWRGTLLPALLARPGPAGPRPLAAALAVGAVWGGLWHGVADWFGVGFDGWVFAALLLMLGPLLLGAWSVLLTWAWLHSGGSLALAVAMHAGLSGSALALAQPLQGPAETLRWTAVQVAVAAAGAALLWRWKPPPRVPRAG